MVIHGGVAYWYARRVRGGSPSRPASRSGDAPPVVSFPRIMRTYRAGDTLEDLCRACKLDRLHTIIVADSSGQPVRVQCDYCGSQHNYRGGGRTPVTPEAPAAQFDNTPGTTARPVAAAAPVPLATERERAVEPSAMSTPDSADLEVLLRRIIREETGLTPAVPAAKWRGGSVVLKPGNPTLQERTWPVDTLFHKIVMIRNRLRNLEQQINGMDLPDDVKVKIQGYITGCYGSLTSFNVLFADEADHFKGAGGE
jgi:hypothetical protein